MFAPVFCEHSTTKSENRIIVTGRVKATDRNRGEENSVKKGYSKIDPEELGKKVLSIISKGLDVEITRDKDGMPKVLAIQKKKVG